MFAVPTRACQTAAPYCFLRSPSRRRRRPVSNRPLLREPPCRWSKTSCGPSTSSPRSFPLWNFPLRRPEPPLSSPRRRRFNFELMAPSLRRCPRPLCTRFCQPCWAASMPVVCVFNVGQMQREVSAFGEWQPTAKGFRPNPVLTPYGQSKVPFTQRQQPPAAGP